MALELNDDASFDGSIGNTKTEQLTVNASTADFFEVLVDDGTTGNDPASYDIRVDVYSTAVDDWMERESLSGLTTNDPDIEENCRGQKVRITITNSSGSSNNYRVSLESYKGY